MSIRSIYKKYEVVKKTRSSTRYKNRMVNAGFTLAELIVVIAIFALITSIALLDQGKLNSKILLTNIAYETALAVREAQVYGLGVRQNLDDTSSSFLGEYGVHYSLDPNSIREIIVYAVSSSASNPMYDGVINLAKYYYEFTNQRGNKIKAICVGNFLANHTTCDSGAFGYVTWLDIVFKRPEPSPYFYSSADNSGLATGPAYIVVTTLDETDCRVVVVQKTGQITVEGPDKGHCVGQ